LKRTSITTFTTDEGINKPYFMIGKTTKDFWDILAHTKRNAKMIYE
jgi:hypothetical protein